jgi:hypothetical protein
MCVGHKLRSLSGSASCSALVQLISRVRGPGWPALLWLYSMPAQRGSRRAWRAALLPRSGQVARQEPPGGAQPVAPLPGTRRGQCAPMDCHVKYLVHSVVNTVCSVGLPALAEPARHKMRRVTPQAAPP